LIEKILNIKNVGRFVSFSSGLSELSFKKYTFIFGKNTHGKSTLVSIFRSLSTGNSDFIIGRKTFNSQLNKK